MSDEEISRTLKTSIRSIPHVKGISNHMCSAFTEDDRCMLRVMEVLKHEDLFFLDSLTSLYSVGVRTARSYSVRSASRNVFLDDEDTTAHI